MAVWKRTVSASVGARLGDGHRELVWGVHAEHRSHLTFHESGERWRRDGWKPCGEVDVLRIVGNWSLSVEHGERPSDEAESCEWTPGMNAGEPVHYLDVHVEQRTVIDWEHGYHYNICAPNYG